MRKLSYLFNIVLLIIIGAIVYGFVIAVNVGEFKDGRRAIVLNESERFHVLGDMGSFGSVAYGVGLI